MIEAIHWRKVDAVIATPGTGLQPSCKANAVFRQRGYVDSANVDFSRLT
jgi:hypothetical protein